MNNPTNQIVTPSTQEAKQAQLAFRIAGTTAMLMAVACIYNIYTALQNQDYLSVAITAIISIVAAIAAWLSRRGRVNLGIGLFITVFCGLMLLAPLSVAEMGLLFAVFVIVLTTGIALATLPPGLAGRMITLSFAVGFLIVLLDLFGPEGRPAPSNPIVSAVIIIGLVAIYGFIMARQFTNFNLRTKLIVGFVLTGVLAAGIIAFATNYLTHQALTNTANETLLAAASQTATDLDTFIVTNQNYLRTQAQLPSLVNYLSLSPAERPGSPLETEASQMLRAFAKQDTLFISSYALLDQQGIDTIDTYAADIGLDKSDRDYFITPLQTGLPYISPARFSDTTGEFAFYLSSPVRNVTGDIIGVLRVRYNASILQQLISQSQGLAGPESFPILLDEHHIRLADSVAPDNILKSVTPLEPALVVELQAEGRLPAGTPEELATNLPSFEQGLLNVSSQPYFTGEVGEEEGEVDEPSAVDLEQGAVASLKTQPWFLAFAQPQEVFLASVQDQTRATVLLTTFITLGVALAALALGQFLARPIVRLTGVAQQVTAGDLEVQATVESQDETGQLAEAFNQMTTQLRNFIGSLEEQVQERTADLALSMAVGQRAAAIRELSELLPTITEFIRQQFNLYYTQVYFVDDLGKNLVLRSGTGTAGRELLSRRHSLPVGVGSIVGRVAADRKSIVVSDTENSDIHLPNPLLPQTRSELAIPLLVEDRVIGVLDMQADQVNTFSETNMTVFEAMATQLAIAIDSAQQWAVAQDSQQRLEEVIKRLTHDTWVTKLAAQKGAVGFAYDLSTITPLQTTPQNGGVSVPVAIQNERIGHLSVNPSSNRALTQDEQDLLAAVAQQLGQKAENIRLFEETQQRATREQLARRIADKVRASRDIETALKTAAQELSKALGTNRAVVDLKIMETSQKKSSE